MSDVLVHTDAPAMPEHAAIHRTDYRPPDWLVPEVALDFALDPELARVRATLKVTRNGDHDRPLRLAGDGLKPLAVEVVAGLIYVSLAASPPGFAPLREEFEAAARPQGFDRAKIARMMEYDVEANWKLVWENNRECFHCTRCHPQYVKANFDIYDEGTASEAVRQRMAAAVERTQSKWASQGIAIT